MTNSEFLTLAGRLKWARLRKNMSQSALAVKCSLTQGTIGHVEAGSRHSLANIARVAHELGVRALWLEEGVGPALEEGTQEAKATKPLTDRPVRYLSPDEVSELISLYARSDTTGRASILELARAQVTETAIAATNAASNKRKRGN